MFSLPFTRGVRLRTSSLLSALSTEVCLSVASLTRASTLKFRCEEELLEEELLEEELLEEELQHLQHRCCEEELRC